MLGPDWPLDMLLYADDLEAMVAGTRGRAALVLAYLVMSATGMPSSGASREVD